MYGYRRPATHSTHTCSWHLTCSKGDRARHCRKPAHDPATKVLPHRAPVCSRQRMASSSSPVCHNELRVRASWREMSSMLGRSEYLRPTPDSVDVSGNLRFRYPRQLQVAQSQQSTTPTRHPSKRPDDIHMSNWAKLALRSYRGEGMKMKAASAA